MVALTGKGLLLCGGVTFIYVASLTTAAALPRTLGERLSLTLSV